MVRTKKKKPGGAAKDGKKPTKREATRLAKASTKAERHALRMQKRKKANFQRYTGEEWSQPAPSHLIARLDKPKIKSKYQSYFEFADNSEKRKKKLEFQVGS